MLYNSAVNSIQEVSPHVNSSCSCSSDNTIACLAITTCVACNAGTAAASGAIGYFYWINCCAATASKAPLCAAVTSITTLFGSFGVDTFIYGKCKNAGRAAETASLVPHTMDATVKRLTETTKRPSLY